MRKRVNGGYAVEDKTLWHEAVAHYRAWNEAEFADRVRRTSEQSLTEKWQAYQDLMAFCWRVNPEASEWEQTQTLKEWESYYSRMRRFEERRRRRDTTT
jgi:hypothetical protein